MVFSQNQPSRKRAFPLIFLFLSPFRERRTNQHDQNKNDSNRFINLHAGVDRIVVNRTVIPRQTPQHCHPVHEINLPRAVRLGLKNGTVKIRVPLVKKTDPGSPDLSAADLLVIFIIQNPAASRTLDLLPFFVSIETRSSALFCSA